MKILVVDDEPIFLELLMQMLKAAGYHDLHSATSGEHALEMINRADKRFDCFLLDIQMDGMSGVDLCARIRGMPRHANTPIVMISAMTDREFVDAAFQAGANDFVNKPVDAREVRARMGMVESLLAERCQVSLVSSQLVDTEQLLGEKVSFDNADILGDCEFLTPLSSLENYVLRLGSLRLLSMAAVGFHVENANAILARSPGLQFADTMAEVGKAISEVLSGGTRFISYFGRGDFCALISRDVSFDRETAEMSIDWKLSQMPGLTAEDPALLPSVAVGPAKRNGLRLFNDPTWMLYAAVEAARTGGETRAPKEEQVIAHVA